MKKIFMITLVAALTFGLAACSGSTAEESGSHHGNSAFMHIHGLGYSPDGKRLIIPVHDGLRVYENDQWSEGSGDKHDYMGFAATDDGFYSSGHPAPGSTYKNPLGLIKSVNDGKTIEVLALEGEVDLHGLTAGYSTHTLYALNPQPNSKMKQTGLYYSQDEGQTWTASPMEEIQGELTAIAAHPDEKSMVVVGTTEGAFLSNDYGKTFTSLLSGKSVSAIMVTKSNNLLVATSGEASLVQIQIETNRQSPIQIPNKDAIIFIAQSPAAENELTIATEQKDVFLSNDGGTSWRQIVSKGMTNQ